MSKKVDVQYNGVSHQEHSPALNVADTTLVKVHHMVIVFSASFSALRNSAISYFSWGFVVNAALVVPSSAIRTILLK